MKKQRNVDSLTAYRRKERDKEKKKNRELRHRARDETILKTAPTQLQKEIQSLKSQLNAGKLNAKGKERLQQMEDAWLKHLQKEIKQASKTPQTRPIDTHSLNKTLLQATPQTTVKAESSESSKSSSDDTSSDTSNESSDETTSEDEPNNTSAQTMNQTQNNNDSKNALRNTEGNNDQIQQLTKNNFHSFMNKQFDTRYSESMQYVPPSQIPHPPIKYGHMNPMMLLPFPPPPPPLPILKATPKQYPKKSHFSPPINNAAVNQTTKYTQPRDFNPKIGQVDFLNNFNMLKNYRNFDDDGLSPDVAERLAKLKEGNLPETSKRVAKTYPSYVAPEETSITPKALNIASNAFLPPQLRRGHQLNSAIKKANLGLAKAMISIEEEKKNNSSNNQIKPGLRNLILLNQTALKQETTSPNEDAPLSFEKKEKNDVLENEYQLFMDMISKEEVNSAEEEEEEKEQL